MLVFILLLPNSFSLSIGTAPGVLDIGEVKAGQTVYFKFYLTTNSKSDILVSMTPIPVHPDMYYRNQTRRYTFIPMEASQQDIKSWIKIINNPVILSPSHVKVVYLPNGGVVRANAEVNVELKVPKDAEPCYYAYSINLSPKLTAGGGGMGVTTIAVTRFIFVFKVKGNAVREGKIVDILADREGMTRARIDVLFKNTGTCTMRARVNPAKLYNNFGNLSTTLSSGYVLVPPTKTVVLSTYWNSPDVEEGDYRVDATVDYTTGKTDMSKTVTIPKVITGRAAKVKMPCRIPWEVFVWIFILVAIIYFIKPRHWGLLVLIVFIIGIVFLLYALVQCNIILGWIIIAMFIGAVLLIIYWKKG